MITEPINYTSTFINQGRKGLKVSYDSVRESELSSCRYVSGVKASTGHTYLYGNGYGQTYNVYSTNNVERLIQAFMSSLSSVFYIPW